MADTTTAGRRRTDLALRIARDCDFEATGQLPAPYNPKRQIAKKVLKGTGKIAWGATKWVFSSRPSRSTSVKVTIIEHTDPFCTFVAVVALVVLGLAVIGGTI